jgi:hypothetical protein
MMDNGGAGEPCKDCGAHSGMATIREVKEMEESAYRAISSKLSLKIFMWIIAGICSFVVLLNWLQWNSVRAADIRSREIHLDVSNQMKDATKEISRMSQDIAVIKEKVQ